MIESVEVHTPSGKIYTYVVGENGVKFITKKKYDWVIIAYDNGEFLYISPKFPVMIFYRDLESESESE